MADRSLAPSTPELRALWCGMAAMAAALCITSPLLAKDEAEIPDHAVVTAAIAAIHSGDAEEAGWLVSQVEGLRYPLKTFATPREAVAALAGCAAEEKMRSTVGGFGLYHFEWTCADKVYIGQLSPDEFGKSVALVDLVTKAEAEADAAREYRPPMIPPPPMLIRRSPLTEKEIALAEAQAATRQTRQMGIATAFANAVADGDVSVFVPRVSVDGMVSYSFHNPFLKQQFVEMSGVGGEALAEQVAHTHSKLGKPSGTSCENSGGSQVFCKWDYPGGAKRLMAFLNVSGYEDVARPLWNVSFRYVTQEKLLEAQERAVD